MSHLCHARGCHTPVPPAMFMCRPHWALVSPDRQRQVWRTYRPGQEIDKSPSEAYLEVAHAAEMDVWTVENLARTHGQIPGLTLIQPYASAIIAGPKRVENRSRPLRRKLTPLEQRIRPNDPAGSQWVAIHAGKRLWKHVVPEMRRLWPECPDATDLPRNAVLGCARVLRWERIGVPGDDDAIVTARAEAKLGAWAFGPWCAVLDVVVPLREPMACGGKLGLWSLPPGILLELLYSRASGAWAA
jgi:hypothetical protein